MVLETIVLGMGVIFKMSSQRVASPPGWYKCHNSRNVKKRLKESAKGVFGPPGREPQNGLLHGAKPCLRAFSLVRSRVCTGGSCGTLGAQTPNHFYRNCQKGDNDNLKSSAFISGPSPLWETEVRQHKRNKDVASDVCLSCSCCPCTGADFSTFLKHFGHFGWFDTCTRPAGLLATKEESFLVLCVTG